MIAHCDFHLNFPDINDTEHLFSYLISISMSSFEICIQILCSFLNWFFFFLLISSMSSLHILDISPLSDMFTNIFSHSVRCLFILLMVSCAVQKLLSLTQSHLFIFAFVAFSFGVNPKIHSEDQRQGAYYLFSSRCFMASALMLKSLI